MYTVYYIFNTNDFSINVTNSAFTDIIIPLAMIRYFCAFIFALALTGEVVYDGSQVFIYNRAARHYRIVTSKIRCIEYYANIRRYPANMVYKVMEEYCPIFLLSHKQKFEHLWTLDAHPTKNGYYYVRNTAWPDDKLRYGTPEKGALGRKNLFAKHLTAFGREQFGEFYVSWDKSYHNYNLFQFIKVGRRNYYIKSPEFGCLKASNRIINVVDCNDNQKDRSAKWRLVPRIKGVKIKAKIIFGPVDNLQGSFPDGPYSITVEHGVTKAKTSQIRDLQSYKVSLEASIGSALSSANIGFEFTQEIENTLTTTEEIQWVRTETRMITVPAHSKYAIVQYVADIEGELNEDSCQILNGNIKIYVTEDGHFYDDDGKIINLRYLR